jgi:hypothetical protein
LRSFSFRWQDDDERRAFNKTVLGSHRFEPSGCIVKKEERKPYDSDDNKRLFFITAAFLSHCGAKLRKKF